MIRRVGFDRITKYLKLRHLAILLMAICFAGIAILPNLRGTNVIPFLAFFISAGTAYFVILIRSDRDNLPLLTIWICAFLFRLLFLFTTPSLSDDVYRYIWDGHLSNLGINPYALPVNHPLLDPYTTPFREMVNNNWMASPYFPALQVIFALVYRIFPNVVTGFQLAACFADLLAGVLIMDLLRIFKLPQSRVAIYLLNPLVVIEFAHAAHSEAYTICLIILVFWLMVRAEKFTRSRKTYLTASSIVFAGASLTKIVPVLLLPLLARRWGWVRILLFGFTMIALLVWFASGAGWGLSGPLNGEGVFGATRIYLKWWNYNSSIYHWLEVALSGYQTPGPVPIDIAGEGIIGTAKAISAGLLLMTVIFFGWVGWRNERSQTLGQTKPMLGLIRLAIIPLGAYIALTPTVHPWYITIVIPLLPFLFPAEGESPSTSRFIWAWIYLSISVSLSYLTYLNLNDLREYAGVREVEYLPFYGLLVWAAFFWLRDQRTTLHNPFKL